LLVQIIIKQLIQQKVKNNKNSNPVANTPYYKNEVHCKSVTSLLDLKTIFSCGATDAPADAEERRRLVGGQRHRWILRVMSARAREHSHPYLLKLKIRAYRLHLVGRSIRTCPLLPLIGPKPLRQSYPGSPEGETVTHVPELRVKYFVSSYATVRSVCAYITSTSRNATESLSGTR